MDREDASNKLSANAIIQQPQQSSEASDSKLTSQTVRKLARCHLFSRTPFIKTLLTPRALLFIALVVPSRRYLSTISSASSLSEGSSTASNPSPSTAEHRTTLLSSSASSDMVRAARNRCIRVCATRGTTNPRCHRVRDSSTGRISSNPANSSAYRSNRRPSLSVIRRATSAARFLTSISSPKSSRTRARTPALSPPISSAIARAVAKPQRAPVSRRRRDSMQGSISNLPRLDIPLPEREPGKVRFGRRMSAYSSDLHGSPNLNHLFRRLCTLLAGRGRHLLPGNCP
jgi:hypothetical protein